jgi:hypothetical protein
MLVRYSEIRHFITFLNRDSYIQWRTLAMSTMTPLWIEYLEVLNHT